MHGLCLRRVDALGQPGRDGCSSKCGDMQRLQSPVGHVLNIETEAARRDVSDLGANQEALPRPPFSNELNLGRGPCQPGKQGIQGLLVGKGQIKPV